MFGDISDLCALLCAEILFEFLLPIHLSLQVDLVFVWCVMSNKLLCRVNLVSSTDFNVKTKKKQMYAFGDIF